jgi:DNA-binding transcriptional regulator YiaG
MKDMMTSKELRAALRALGLQQRQPADQLDVTKRSVNRWATGDLPVPGYAEAYLKLLLRGGESGGRERGGRLVLAPEGR